MNWVVTKMLKLVHETYLLEVERPL